MTVHQPTPGIAVICSADGFIRAILHDGLALGRSIRPGQPFSLLLDRGSLAKSVDFLAAIRDQDISIGWELIITHAHHPYPVLFTGGLLGDELILIGARTHADLLQVYEDLLQQMLPGSDALRCALERHYAFVKHTTQPENNLYDEVSRLNNDLIVTQRALAKANVELEQLNALKNQFLGMAAHDLRSPLSAILSYSEFLINEAAPSLTEEHARFLEIIHSSSTFMLTLINDLLDVAVIESGKLHLELKPTDLSALITRVVENFRVLAMKKSMHIELVTIPLPLLLLDAVKIEQVINNLLGNALKFSPNASTITVSIERHPTEIHLLVHDEGPDIPVEDLDKLFHLFQQTTVRVPSGEKSSGLGLAIARRIIRGHGGRIWVKSTGEHGKSFIFALPCVE